MLPSGPVLTNAETAVFDNVVASGVNYLDEPKVDYPVLPFQIFGLYYDLDLVLVTQDTGWDMHEYARIQTPDGPIWMAKDSKPDGVQTIVSDVEDLLALVAEVPVPRVAGAIQVEDNSQDDLIDVQLKYTNPDGVETEVVYNGHLPSKPPRQRNGSTMGHSRQAVAAILDLERFGTQNKASVIMAGQPVKVKRLFGVVPMLYTLQQAQGGFAIASWTTQGDANGFELSRPATQGDLLSEEENWPTLRTESWTVTHHAVSADFGLNQLVYEYQERELVGAKAQQWGRNEPVFELHIHPALPDLSRPFEGIHRSQFRMDINGQKGHGTGVIRTQWNDDMVEIEIIPEAPWWLADRPMHGTIVFPGNGTTETQIHRSVLPQ